MGAESMAEPVRRVTVVSVDATKSVCLVRDDHGREFGVPSTLHPAHTVPRAGETWYIDRVLGIWSFCRMQDGSPRPVVSGSWSATGGLAAILESVIDVLSELGLIIDGTTT